MGHDFLRRVQITSLITSLVLFFGVASRFGPMYGVGFLVGSAWSIVNLEFIGALLKSFIATRKKKNVQIALIFLVKFPVIYAVGFIVLRSDLFPVLSVLGGFMWPTLVMVLKALGRLILGMDATGRTAAAAESEVVHRRSSRELTGGENL